MGERGGLIRWLLLGLVVFLSIQLFSRFFGGKKDHGKQPIYGDSFELPPDEKDSRPAEQLCDIWRPEYRAQFTSYGAALKHFRLLSAKYRTVRQLPDGSKRKEPLDLSTTPDVEQMRQLLFHWKNRGVAPAHDASWNVAYDSMAWHLEKADGKSCTFTYRDEKVELRKVINATDRAYELSVAARITNLAETRLTHALTIESTAWRTDDETGSKMFRVSPFRTFVECVSESRETTRLDPGDFDPDDFEKAQFERNELNVGPDRGEWYQAEEPPAYTAVSNAYFSQALIPSRGGRPVCQLQIWTRTPTDGQSFRPGKLYRSRLAYPKRELAPSESAEYAVSTYIGPKERDVLAAAGGQEGGLGELINLGFFSVIAKVLVAFLLKVHSVIPNWGIAIIVLTLTARMLLFPLSVPMIKNSVRMRRLKPEMDALNEKYKDDTQQRGLAQMELWRKHGVSPFKGCLPQIASMPVWFALYTTLQTAVELYNIPFLWFPDLSAADPYYVLPFVIGSTTFIQQKLMPQQGDPAQQKMLRYFMPAMFTVFMLFLPSGLGVYMFTNGLIAIGQQQLVEWHVRRNLSDEDAGAKEATVVEAQGEDGPAKSRRSKRRRSRKGSKKKVSENRPLLDKGRA